MSDGPESSYLLFTESSDLLSAIKLMLKMGLWAAFNLHKVTRFLLFTEIYIEQ